MVLVMVAAGSVSKAVIVREEVDVRVTVVGTFCEKGY